MARIVRPAPIAGPGPAAATLAPAGRHRSTMPTPAPPLQTKAARPTFDEVQHPRDRKGRFIETGAEVRILGGALAKVIKNVGGGRFEVQRESDGQHVIVHRNYLEVTKRADGSAPAQFPGDKPKPAPVEKSSPGAVEADADPSTPARSTMPGDENLDVRPEGVTEESAQFPRSAIGRARGDRVHVRNAALQQGDVVRIQPGFINGIQRQQVIGRILGFRQEDSPFGTSATEVARVQRADGTVVSLPLYRRDDRRVRQFEVYVPGKEPKAFATAPEAAAGGPPAADVPDQSDSADAPSLRAPAPGWGQPYGGGDGKPNYDTPDGPVWMFRNGQRVRFYDADGNQVGNEQSNVAPAVAYAQSQGWTAPRPGSPTEGGGTPARGLDPEDFPTTPPDVEPYGRASATNAPADFADGDRFLWVIREREGNGRARMYDQEGQQVGPDFASVYAADAYGAREGFLSREAAARNRNARGQSEQIRRGQAERAAANAGKPRAKYRRLGPRDEDVADPESLTPEQLDEAIGRLQDRAQGLWDDGKRPGDSDFDRVAGRIRELAAERDTNVDRNEIERDDNRQAELEAADRRASISPDQGELVNTRGGVTRDAKPAKRAAAKRAAAKPRPEPTPERSEPTSPPVRSLDDARAHLRERAQEVRGEGQRSGDRSPRSATTANGLEYLADDPNLAVTDEGWLIRRRGDGAIPHWDVYDADGRPMTAADDRFYTEGAARAYSKLAHDGGVYSADATGLTPDQKRELIGKLKVASERADRENPVPGPTSNGEARNNEPSGDEPQPEPGPQPEPTTTPTQAAVRPGITTLRGLIDADPNMSEEDRADLGEDLDRLDRLAGGDAAEDPTRMLLEVRDTENAYIAATDGDRDQASAAFDGMNNQIVTANRTYFTGLSDQALANVAEDHPSILALAQMLNARGLDDDGLPLRGGRHSLPEAVQLNAPGEPLVGTRVRFNQGSSGGRFGSTDLGIHDAFVARDADGNYRLTYGRAGEEPVDDLPDDAWVQPVAAGDPGVTMDEAPSNMTIPEIDAALSTLTQQSTGLWRDGKRVGDPEFDRVAKRMRALGDERDTPGRAEEARAVDDQAAGQVPGQGSLLGGSADDVNPEALPGGGDTPGRAAVTNIAVPPTGHPDGAGTLEDPIDVGDDVARAAQLIAEGKHVRLNQPDQLSTLLDEVRKLVDDANNRGERTPFYDLCRVAVTGTNLFCKQSRGISRARMPQLSGAVVPDSPAAALAGANGRANLSGAFRDALVARGLNVDRREVRADHLRASQSELDGVKVAEMTAAIRDGKIADRPIFVSRDGYVVDGHHYWAAKVALAADDPNLTMNVEQVDMGIGELIDYANAYSLAMGIRPKPGAVVPDDIKALVEQITPNAPAAQRDRGPISDADYADHAAKVEGLLADAADLATDRTMTLDGDSPNAPRIYRGDRAAQHDEIVADVLARNADVPREGKAIIAGGLGGAGKGTTLSGAANVDQSQYLTLNPDDIKEIMAERGMIPDVPGTTPMEASNLVHEEASFLANLIAARAYEQKTNVIWDITMSSNGSVQRRIDEMRAAGYGDVQAIFVDIPVETSVERALSRHRRGLDDFRAGKGNGGRYVPPSLIRSNADPDYSSRNRRVFEDLRPKFDAWQSFDNSVPGRPAQLIASGRRGDDVPDLGDLNDLGGLSDDRLTSERATTSDALATAWRAGLRDGDAQFDGLMRRARTISGEQQRRASASLNNEPQVTPARELAAGSQVVIEGRDGYHVMEVVAVQRSGGTVRMQLRDADGGTLDYEASDSDALVAATGSPDGLGGGVDLSDSAEDADTSGDATGAADGAVLVSDLQAGTFLDLAGRRAEVTAVTDGQDAAIRVVSVRYPDGTTQTAPFGRDAALTQLDAPTPPAIADHAEGTTAARPSLYTYQRRNLVALGLDLDPDQNDDVRQAAARVRARKPLSAEQAATLADAVRARSARDGIRPVQQRAMARLAWRFDAAAAQAQGLKAPDLPNQAVRPAAPGDVTTGDHIALPGPRGGMITGKVTGVRALMGGRLVEISIEGPDGESETRLVSRGTPTFVLPDLPAPVSPPVPNGHAEWVEASELRVGDVVQHRGNRAGGDTQATIVSIDEHGQATLDVLNDSPYLAGDQRPNVVLGDSDSVLRIRRGPASQDQAPGVWAQRIDAEPEDTTVADLQVGDFVDVQAVNGSRSTGWVQEVEGGRLSVMQENGIVQGILGPERATIRRLAPYDDGVAVRLHEREKARRLANYTGYVATSLARVQGAVLQRVERGTLSRITDRAGLAVAIHNGDITINGGGIDATRGVAYEAAGLVAGRGNEAGRAALATRLVYVVDELHTNAINGVLQSLTDAVPGPGESYGDALVRTLDAYASDPPRVQDLLTAAGSLAQLRDALNVDSTPVDVARPVEPIGDLKTRIGKYREALGSGFGKAPTRVPTVQDVKLSDLVAGKVPEVTSVLASRVDRADDGGPGATAMRHLDVVQAAGRDIDAVVQEDVRKQLSASLPAGVLHDGETVDDALARLTRDVNAQPALDVQAYRDYLRIAREERTRLFQERHPDPETESRRIAQERSGWNSDGGKYRTLVQQRVDLNRQIATARREATIRALTNLGISMGEGGMDTYYSVDKYGQPKARLGERDRKVKAMRFAEKSYPSSWLKAWRAREKNIRGQGRDGKYQLKVIKRGHYADDDGYIALSGRAGELIPDSTDFGPTAAHELGHAMERAIPGLVAAQEAFLWARLATGDTGQRQLPALKHIYGGKDTEVGWEDEFPGHYSGKTYVGSRTGSAHHFEVFTTSIESLMAGSSYTDEAMRQWTLGVLATLGHDDTPATRS